MAPLRTTCALMALLFLFLAPLGHAEMSIRMAVKQPAPDPLVVGEPFTLEIDLQQVSRSNESAAWTLAGGSASRWLKLGALLLDQQSIGESSSRTQKFEVKAIATKAGTLEIPPLALREEGGTKTVTALGFTLQVASNLNGQVQAASWIAAPLIFGGWDKVKLFTLVLMALAALGGLIYLLLRLRRKKQAPLSPYQIACRDLQQWERTLQDANARETSKTFAFAISAVVRKYLSNHSGHNLLDTTDRELVERLRESKLDPLDLEALRSGLLAIETARYGDAKLDREQALRILQGFRQWLEKFESRQNFGQKAPAEKSG